MEVLRNAVCVSIHLFIFCLFCGRGDSITFHFVADSEDDSSDTDINDEDIESMLNERLPEELKNKKVEAQYEEKFKTVLEGKQLPKTFSFAGELVRLTIASIPQRRDKIISKFCRKDG